MPELRTSGVTRLVVLTHRWAIKLPRLRSYRLRGWLANRSEWQQRRRVGVNRPVLTLGHVVTVYRRADELGTSGEEFYERMGFTGDEAKPSSWGRFDCTWLLIDYDRAWEHPRGLVGGIYYWNQERLARKWMNLPSARIPDKVLDGVADEC